MTDRAERTAEIAHETPLPPMGWAGTVLFFGCGGLLLYLVIHMLLPAASAATGIEPVVLWFLLAGSVFVAPVVIAGVLVLRQEAARGRGDLWRRRLRFRPLGAADWLWALGALAAIAVLSVGSMLALRLLPGEGPPAFFLAMEPLTPRPLLDPGRLAAILCVERLG